MSKLGRGHGSSPCPWEQIPSTSTALSDLRSVANESTSKSKDAEKFVFEPWPHALKFNSRKVSFNREVMSGSPAIG